MENGKAPVTVVGGGLVGSLLSIYLANRGFKVSVYEGRSDLREDSESAGRSINLILNARGVNALEEVGLLEAVLEKSVSVTGRCIHAIDGSVSHQAYGTLPSHCNYSISRKTLNEILLNGAELAGVRFQFNERLVGADLTHSLFTFENVLNGHQQTVTSVPIIGADGAVSVLRQALNAGENIQSCGFGYKEILVPALNGDFALAPNFCHIWPRKNFMLMALPNWNRSFTATLFLPLAGDLSFHSLKDEESISKFFKQYFPDFYNLVPDLPSQAMKAPVGKLLSVNCEKWYHEHQALLMGDAAHAMLPFFGQGANCGFEDCVILNELMDEYGDDWSSIFSQFYFKRKPNTDAIRDLSQENFEEMRAKVANPLFLMRKKIEHLLEKHFPGRFFSLYSLISYSRTPYLEAVKISERQRPILDRLCQSVGESPESVDLDEASGLIDEQFEKIAA